MSREDIRSVVGSRLLIADGSTGTALEALAPGRSATFLPLEDPALVESLHRAYFEAGSDIVETATFSASARTLAKLGADGAARELNRAAAVAAVRAARVVEVSDGRTRWVAGSVGPGEDPPSLGAATYEALAASYLPQMLGLLEGGADLVIIETCQDPLQIKAALGALFDAGDELGRSVPFIVSATVDASGRMLTGTGVEALAAIVAPFRPLALGLNCSGGPDELSAPFSALAEVSPAPLCIMPNAGLPLLDGVRVTYPLGPDEFARRTAGIARRCGAAIVGGCCGTGPEHIRALVRQLADRPAPSRRPIRKSGLASLYESWSPGSGLLRVGERANAAGSAAFSKLVRAEDVEGQSSFALAQEEFGVHALDLHLARPGRDEAADLSALVGRLAGSARAALSLDSADPEVLAAALPRVGGRPLVNSANLESPEKARNVFRLARRFGAAMVCLALDGDGPARSAEKKADVCRRLYDLALTEGLAPEDLYFDCLTFSLASESKGFEGAAAQTLKALPLVKEACPGSRTILGVGNISFGLPRPLRPAVTAVFLAAARAAGLDAAILDPELPEAEAVDPALRSAVETLIRGGASSEERTAALETLLALDPGASAVSEPDLPETADPAERLKTAIQRGEARTAASIAEGLISETGEGAGALTAGVSEAMSIVGDRFAAGKLPLPRVLRSAEAAEAALKTLTAVPRPESSRPGRTVVMATVKGDLHDIGKNLTGLILASSGYRVVDLGVDVGTERLVKAVRAEKASALGLSGLLTRSLDEMRKAAEALREARLPALLLLGGAAVDRGFVEAHLAPLRPGRVRACADAFEALKVLAEESPRDGQDEYSDASADGVDSESGSSASVSSVAVAEALSASSESLSAEAEGGKDADGQIAPWTPPFQGSRVVSSLALEDLLAVLDRRTLTRVRWGYGRKRDTEAREAFERVENIVRTRDLCRASGVYGYFPCADLGGGLLRVGTPGGGAWDLRFPVETGGRHRSIPRYFRRSSDFVPFFAVTAGAELPRAAAELKRSGSYEEYFHLHGFAAALAEAAAEILHRRIGEEIVASGAPCSGRRYSFGYPGCPGVEAQDDLLSLLGADRIGVRATEGHQLVPEFSVTAFIVPRPGTEYFSA